METSSVTAGIWRPTGARGASVAFDAADLLAHIGRLREPLCVVRNGISGRIGTAIDGEVHRGQTAEGEPTYEVLAQLPAMYPEWLGDRSFCQVHGVRFPYVAGAMANGIATTRMVIAMAEAQMLGFFGAAGLPNEQVERAIDEIKQAIGQRDLAWGANLIHSPHEPELEEQVAELYIRKGVKRVSAAAYMRLTPSIVRYAYSGIGVDNGGRVVRQNHVFAKISRPEVAEHFMSPAPAKMLAALVAAGKLTPAEANLAAQLPVAEDITVEADSGGHTDNRPLSALLPTILALRNELVARHRYPRPIRVGVAGGLGTPGALAAAFAMGASYVLTGSINQPTREAGLCQAGKELLGKASIADVAMAPSPDMFELGIKVQVLKRGTLFASRAQHLYHLYSSYPDWSSIPADKRQRVEKEIFQQSFASVWAETEGFWLARKAEEVERAKANGKHQMALAFRWYLGLSSHWSIVGTPQRVLDYQIWCGPAMGAFNAWVRGSFLEPVENRSVVQVARNLLEGAALITRSQQLRSYGVSVPNVAFDFRPVPLG